MALLKQPKRFSTRLCAGLFFIVLLLSCNVWTHGVLRWEQAKTTKYIRAVEANDAKQLDALFWPRRFAPGTRHVVNSWMTDFGSFPQQAACDSSRPIEMPSADRKLDLRLWLLSPTVPIIRHRLEVQIGDDGKVTDASYDTHTWHFTATSASGGSFTNRGLSFGFYIPIPTLVCIAIVSWLLAIACRALAKRVRSHRIAGAQNSTPK